jgi:hypothetical protein
MLIYTVKEKQLTDIADAIRMKHDTTEQLSIEEMPEMIRSIASSVEKPENTGMITVAVESGSTVACTNGTVTKTATSTGTVVFSGLSFGTWTITATKDSKKAIHIVELNYPNISMFYEITLYDAGDNASMSGGWERITYTGSDLTESSYNGTVNVRAKSGGVGIYLTKNEIDVTGFTKLQYKCSKGGDGAFKVVLLPPGTTAAADAVIAKEVTNYTDSPTALEELDISSISGKCRIGLSLVPAYSNSILNAYMNYMKLS